MGTNYAYPSQTEMNWYWANKLRIMRVPVKWERLQLELFGPLAGANDDMTRLDNVINHFEKLGGTVILDVHNYGGNKAGGKIAFDNPIVSTAAFVDLWVKLAARYANRAVWFDLMNEPEGDRQGAIRVAAYMQCVVNAIRARTDALNMILVEGQRYSSAQFWVREGQAAALETFYDPADNFCFSPHSYVDGDASGTSAVCVSGSARLTAITKWAAERGFKLWLGEIAGGDHLIPLQENCLGIMTQAYTYIRDQSPWLGVSVWGGGRRWPLKYEFRFDPANYVDAPNTGCFKAVQPFLPA
ncbi:cellulase family glycosylhydrolase [Sphingomonas sp. SAFR-052]|uniref:cellulase family glycosylhydrolase n=1 Tax=Sphingomonas sp. SAFR-052 TaxID=3436867 RepID=UPI003F80FD89